MTLPGEVVWEVRVRWPWSWLTDTSAEAERLMAWAWLIGQMDGPMPEQEWKREASRLLREFNVTRWHRDRLIAFRRVA